MASRSLGVLRNLGKLVKQRLRLARPPRPAVPVPARKPLFFANRNAIYRAPRSAFQGPHLGLERSAAVRLGFCVELAPLASTSQTAFWSMNRVASNCLASVYEHEGERPAEIKSLDQLDTGPFLQKGSNGAVYAARLKTAAETSHRLLQPDLRNWPLVFKMVFNFYGDAREPSAAEVADMFRAESVPFALLPEHPCVAKVLASFVDDVPELPMAKELFPVACPPALYPELGDSCLGREKTLFVVMKRYSSSLSERLAAGPLAAEEAERVLLQLLEANVLLQRSGIAHRDLHTKNVLLEERSDGKLSACIADFGCSTVRLQRSRHAGFAPYSAPGNGNLQAPECADLDYRQSDLWAIGAIAYNLFSPGHNPFVNSLDARTYQDSDLPPVSGAPAWLSRLVRQMLRRDPRQRPSGELCADVLQLMALRPPSEWLLGPKLPAAADLRDWVLLQLVRLMLTFRRDEDQRLRLYFFNRLTEDRLRQALRWLRIAFRKSNEALAERVVEHFEPSFQTSLATVEE